MLNCCWKALSFSEPSHPHLPQFTPIFNLQFFFIYIIMNQEKNEKIYSNIKIFLTGYGPWGDHKSNPTMDVVKALCEEKKKEVETEHTKLVEYEIYEVKVEYVDEHIRKFYEKFNEMKKEENTLYIVVHYGLYAGTKMIQIETRGVNYINDNDNHNGLIDKNSTEYLYTKFDTEKIVNYIKEHNVECKVSDDAGTFLCNYMLFNSLNLSKDLPKTKALFIHIPNFEDYSLDKNIQFFKTFIKALEELFIKKDNLK